MFVNYGDCLIDAKLWPQMLLPNLSTQKHKQLFKGHKYWRKICHVLIKENKYLLNCVEEQQKFWKVNCKKIHEQFRAWIFSVTNIFWVHYLSIKKIIRQKINWSHEKAWENVQSNIVSFFVEYDDKLFF